MQVYSWSGREHGKYYLGLRAYLKGQSYIFSVLSGSHSSNRSVGFWKYTISLYAGPSG